MKRINDTIYNAIDDKGRMVTYNKCMTLRNGVVLSDDILDGVVYKKLGNEYFKRSIENGIMLEWYPDSIIRKNDINFDNAPALQKIIDLGEPLFLEDNSTYFINSSLFLRDKTKIFGNNATLKWAINANTALLQTEEITKLSENTAIVGIKGSKTFEYVNANLLEIGDFIYLKGNVYLTVGINTYENGWYSQIEEIDGTTVTLSTPCACDVIFNRISSFQSYSNISINDINIDCKGGSNGFGINISNVTFSTLNNVRTFSDNLPTSPVCGINLVGEECSIINCKASDFRFTSSGPGYGFNIAGHNNLVKLCKTTGCKHGITSAGRTYFSTNLAVENCRSFGGKSAAFDFHGNVIDSKFEDCVAYVTTGLTGFALRSSTVSLINCKSYIQNVLDSDVRGIVITENGGSNTDILNFRCFINPSILSGSHKAIFAFNTSQPIKNLNISKGYMEGQIEFSEVETENLIIRDVDFEGTENLESYINLGLSAKDYLIENNKFTDKQPNVVFDYCINTPLTGFGRIEKNEFHNLNNQNNNYPIRLNADGNIIKDNLFYTETNNLVKDKSSFKVHLLNNYKVDGNLNYKTVAYDALPTPDSFYSEKLICVYANNLMSFYLGTPTGFLKIPDLTGDIFFGSKLTAQKIIAQDGDGASIILGANTGSKNLTSNTPKSARAMMPTFQSDNNTSNLMTLLFGVSDGENWLRYGGGTGAGIPATTHEFYTGEPSQLSAGNRVQRIYKSGRVVTQYGGTYTEEISSRYTINSNSEGFLPPRLTKSQRLAIIMPAVGLKVYQLTGVGIEAEEGEYIYTSTGWKKLNY